MDPKYVDVETGAVIIEHSLNDFVVVYVIKSKGAFYNVLLYQLKIPIDQHC